MRDGELGVMRYFSVCLYSSEREDTELQEQQVYAHKVRQTKAGEKKKRINPERSTAERKKKKKKRYSPAADCLLSHPVRVFVCTC